MVQKAMSTGAPAWSWTLVSCAPGTAGVTKPARVQQLVPNRNLLPLTKHESLFCLVHKLCAHSFAAVLAVAAV